MTESNNRPAAPTGNPGQGGGANRNKRRRPRGGQNRGPRNPNTQGQNPAAPQQAQNNGPRPQDPTRKKNNNRRRNNNRNRRTGQGPRLTPLERAQKQYLLLLERQIQKRKKFYEFFYRADLNQLRKIEDQFYAATNELRAFPDTLPEDVRKEFDLWNNGMKHDYSYALNHELELETTPPSSEGNFEDPHYLPSQKEADFSNDTEESVGTIEDYRQLKGIEADS